MNKTPSNSSTVVCLLLLLVGCAQSNLEAGSPKGEKPQTELRFTEHLIMDGYAYPFGIAAADLDGERRSGSDQCGRDRPRHALLVRERWQWSLHALPDPVEGS